MASGLRIPVLSIRCHVCVSYSFRKVASQLPACLRHTDFLNRFYNRLQERQRGLYRRTHASLGARLGLGFHDKHGLDAVIVDFDHVESDDY